MFFDNILLVLLVFFSPLYSEWWVCVFVYVASFVLHSSFASLDTVFAFIPNDLVNSVLKMNHFGKFGAYFVNIWEKSMISKYSLSQTKWIKLQSKALDLKPHSIIDLRWASRDRRIYRMPYFFMYSHEYFVLFSKKKSRISLLNIL